MHFTALVRPVNETRSLTLDKYSRRWKSLAESTLRDFPVGEETEQEVV